MEPFKNSFSPELVGLIATHLQKHLPSLDRNSFEAPVQDRLLQLELKPRAQLIADHLHIALPKNFAKRDKILRAMMHPDEAAKQSDEHGISGWGMMPLTMVVGQHGVADFDAALLLLKDMTSRFSSEFAVRYFLVKDLPRALKIMESWASDKNHYVRRLVSEGTRPRLPWAMQITSLIDDPAPILPILESLRDDSHEYVRRSVANHLNDIAKDHPDLIGDLANDWMKGADKNRQRLVRHACRSLIKQGHTNALAAFGISAPKIELQNLKISTPSVEFGGIMDFTAQILSTSEKPQALVIDYLMHFKKANGKLAAKVFKWTKFELAPGEIRSLKKSHPIKPITTRKYYAGTQGLSLRINGSDFGLQKFTLNMPSA